MAYHKMIVVILFVFFSFSICRTEAQQICATEIFVNDSKASILIDGRKVGVGKYTAHCKQTSQKVVIVSSDNIEFTRTLPSAADFKEQDRLWNVRLQSYISRASQPRKPSTVTAPNFTSQRIPAASALHYTPLKGIYIQVQAIRGFTSDPAAASKVLNALRPKLSKMQITLCPSVVPVETTEWTKVLVGPFKTLATAKKLMSELNANSFLMKDPLCESKTRRHFTIEEK